MLNDFSFVGKKSKTFNLNCFGFLTSVTQTSNFNFFINESEKVNSQENKIEII
jgi:hypothetical protein